MKTRIIRMVALMLAVLMCFSSLTACKKKSETSSEGNVDTSSDFFNFESDTNNIEGNTESDTESDNTSNKDKTTVEKENYGNKEVVDRDFQWPELKFNNKKLTWLFWGGEGYETNATAKKLKEVYGIEVDVINAVYGEMSSKLAALVMSGQSPDMVRMIDGSSGNFPGYIYKELIQPVDNYVNWKNPIYTDQSYYYSKSKVNGKNYMLFNYTSTGGVVVYNKKMFKEAGVTEPYTLYKQGKWDWNTFADVASKLTADTDGDGTIDRKAYALGSGDAFIYTTGQTFGALDHKNKKFKSNLKNADIARAVDFINNLGFTKKLGDHGIVNADELFKSELVAMNIISDGEHTRVGGWTTEIAKRGDLGIAPLPKDPEADKLYYYVWADSIAIPTGAKNPNAAVAYHAVRRYLETNPDEVSSTHKKWKTSTYWNDENIEAYYASVNDGQPVWDTVAWAGNQIVWNSVLMGIPWSARVAAEADKTEAQIKAAFDLE